MRIRSLRSRRPEARLIDAWKQRRAARWLASDGALSGPEAARFALEQHASCVLRGISPPPAP